MEAVARVVLSDRLDTHLLTQICPKGTAMPVMLQATASPAKAPASSHRGTESRRNVEPAGSLTEQQQVLSTGESATYAKGKAG